MYLISLVEPVCYRTVLYVIHLRHNSLGSGSVIKNLVVQLKPVLSDHPFR